MKKLPSIWLGAAISVIFTGAYDASFARNPLKSDPSTSTSSQHLGGTVPTLPVITPPAATPPGVGDPSTASFTFTDYKADCHGDGEASAGLESRTVGKKREMFVRLDARNGNHGISASCNCVLSQPLKVQQPFQFQLIGGNALRVSVVFQNSSKQVETLTFERPGAHLGYPTLKSLGNDIFGIPVGSAAKQVPLDAVIESVNFVHSPPGNCMEFTSHFNNLVMGSVSSKIDTTSHTQRCGSGSCGGINYGPIPF